MALFGAVSKYDYSVNKPGGGKSGVFSSYIILLWFDIKVEIEDAAGFLYDSRASFRLLPGLGRIGNLPPLLLELPLDWFLFLGVNLDFFSAEGFSSSKEQSIDDDDGTSTSTPGKTGTIDASVEGVDILSWL